MSVFQALGWIGVGLTILFVAYLAFVEWADRFDDLDDEAQ